jgi:hypothetical protein
VSVSQSQEGRGRCQLITGEERVVSANHRRGEASCFLAVGDQYLPAAQRGDYHRRPLFRVLLMSANQTQAGSSERQPITGGERAVSANRRRGEASC